MRTLKLNEQSLKYSLWQTSEIETYYDSEGDTVTLVFPGDDGDEEILMTKAEEKITYSEAVEFKANISPSGSSEAEAVSSGIDTTSFDAIIVTKKDKLPLDEKSVIWVDSEVEYKSDETPNPKSSDYTVTRIDKTLNIDRILLKKTNRQDYE